MTWDCLLIGKAIYATLNGLTGISTRIYPMRIPQEIDLSANAAISYYVISTNPELVKDSRSVVDSVRFQVSIFAPSYTTANSIAQLVREALDGLSGEVGGTSIDSMHLNDESDLFEDDVKIYHRVQEYIARVKNDASVNYNSTVPVGPVSATDDYTWTNAIPAGYMLESIVFDETTGHSPILSCGTTAGGDDVFSSETLAAGAFTCIDVMKLFSKVTATTLYIHDSISGNTWNGAGGNFYITLRKYV